MDRVCVLITIAFCSLCYRIDAQSVDTLFINAAYAKLQSAAAYTLDVANTMPAENYAYKPSFGEMSFGQQLTHLSRNLGWLSSSYLGNKDTNPVSEADLKLHQKDSIIAVVSRVYDYSLAKLKQFDPDQLSDTVSFFAGPMSKLQIINLINDHQTHHRGQLVVYLRLNGLTPPSYVGW
ncbi:MAG: DinB family protein [Cyclobacteriaceae bacterium]